MTNEASLQIWNRTHVQRVVAFVNNAHRGQMYGTNVPFSVHQLMALQVAVRHLSGNEPNVEELLLAVYAHDVLEDTDVTYAQLAEVAGEKVADYVYGVTDEAGRNRKERKQKTYPKIAAERAHVFIKLCDRIANVAYSKYMDHSNDSKFTMYQNEHPEFESALYNPHHGLSDMWSELEGLLV